MKNRNQLLRSARLRAGKTGAEVASLVGYGETRISKLENAAHVSEHVLLRYERAGLLSREERIEGLLMIDQDEDAA